MHAAQHRFKPLWCNSSTAGRFLYSGADVDVELLHFLEPNEDESVFIDSLATPDVDYFSTWERKYRDSNLDSYRMTTKQIRHMRNDNNEKVIALQTLLQGRLHDVFGPPVTSAVTSADTVEANFTYHGRARRLTYLMRSGFSPSLLGTDRPTTTFTHIGMRIHLGWISSKWLGLLSDSSNQHGRAFRYIGENLQNEEYTASLPSGDREAIEKASGLRFSSRTYAPAPRYAHRLAGVPILTSNCFT